MKSFNLRISAIHRDFYTGPCESVTFPTIDGEVGILAGHEPTVYAVDAGELRFTANGETKILAVGDGFARVDREKVVILVDFAELASEIDEVRAEDSRTRAESIIKANADSKMVAQAEVELTKAIVRLKVAKKGHM